MPDCMGMYIISGRRYKLYECLHGCVEDCFQVKEQAAHTVSQRTAGRTVYNPSNHRDIFCASIILATRMPRICMQCQAYAQHHFISCRQIISAIASHLAVSAMEGCLVTSAIEGCLVTSSITLCFPTRRPSKLLVIRLVVAERHLLRRALEDTDFT